MKHILTLAMALALAGCATAIPISGEQYCAFRGMKVSGFSGGTVSSSAYNWQSGSTVTGHSTYGGYSCRMPADQKEECEVSRDQYINAPIQEYNSGVLSKYFVTAAGYWFFVVPGVVAKVIYDGEKSEAIEIADARAKETAAGCVQRSAASTAIPQ